MKRKIIKIALAILLISLAYIINSQISKGYEFENELKGSTGWSTILFNLKQEANESSTEVCTLPAGKAFRILEETGEYWKIDYDGTTGYVQHKYCMINLPDIMPSIIYNITNADSSIYKSSGYDIDDVTGEKLYTTGKIMNNKLGREEYVCPILYSTASKIAIAQKQALNDGYCLKIYDSYRPRSVSKKIANKLNVLYSSNSEVKNNIDYSIGASGTPYYWGQSWFLAQGLSTHNVGAAIDVTLCKNDTKEECKMPTAMHELSTKAIKYYSGSCQKSPTNYSKEMTYDAKRLDNYMTSAGMATLASEWWHFQENEGYKRIKSATNENGCDFQIEGIVSTSGNDEPEGPDPGTTKLKGDVNGNGMVDVQDAVEVLTISSKVQANIPVEIDWDTMDVDGDNFVTVQDAVYILTYYAKEAAGQKTDWSDVIIQ